MTFDQFFIGDLVEEAGEVGIVTDVTQTYIKILWPQHTMDSGLPFEETLEKDSLFLVEAVRKMNKLN